MAITLVDVGTTANDGTGDPLRTAFQTVNTALTRLDNTVNIQTGYVLLKDDGGSTGVVVTTAGSVGINNTAPVSKLHVEGSLAIGTAGTEDVLTMGRGVNTGISFQNVATFALGKHSATVQPVTQLDLKLKASGTINYTADTTVMSWLDTGDTKFYNAGATVGMTWDASTNSNAGGLGIRTAAPTGALDVNDDTIRVRTAKTPASAAATGNAGDICWDTSYIYVCTATNTWKRSAIATW